MAHERRLSPLSPMSGRSWRCRSLPRLPAIGAEVVFAIQHEWARTVSDFLIRRTAMAWRNPPAAIASAPAVARIMADVLGWDRAHREAELAAFAHLMNNRASGVIPSPDGEEVAFDA